MHNDEINGRVIAVIQRGGTLTARQLIRLLKTMLRESQHRKRNPTQKQSIFGKMKKVRVKDLVQKGKVETLEINDTDLKTLKKELKRYGVQFTVKKDTLSGHNIIFFQAKDERIMERAFQKAVKNFVSEKGNKRESVMQRLNRWKEKVKNNVDQDKVRQKHQEQSL